MKNFLKSLPFPNDQSIVLIDVGARWGINPPWNQIDHQHITYYGFEPDKDECALLNDKGQKNTTYFPLALSDAPGKAVLYLTKEPGCSSLLIPNNKFLSRFHLSERWEIVKKIEIETIPLKNVLVANNILPDIIKIDVQGLALRVLKGIGNTIISDTLFFEIELEYNEMYKGEGLFFSVSELMLNNGFELLDICNYYAKRKNMPISNSTRGQIMFADALFIISPDVFFSKLIDKKVKYKKIWKIVFILSIYGHFDLALEFALHPDSSLTDEEKSIIKKKILHFTALNSIRIFLFNNTFFEKAGYLISIFGNYFQVKSRLFGWFSDNNSISSRFKKQFRNPILNLIFRR